MQSHGLVDLQVNGFAGVDFNTASLQADAFDKAVAAMFATGVTTFLPTIITASTDDLSSRFAALDRAVAQSRLGRLMVPGYHLEGPFLNPADGYAGCHPPAVMIAPDSDLVFRLEAGLSRPILLITIAPELPGSEDFIRTMSAAGKIVAIGHSAADAQTIERAVQAGARMSTHLGNGIPQILPKLDNTIFAQLAHDGLHASFIGDGIHLPQPALRAMVRAKGIARSILVTDAVSAAATAPGTYAFAGMVIEHGTDGSVRKPGGRTLAGSALTMDRAVRKIVEWRIASASEAFAMASDNPFDLLAPALQAHGVMAPDRGRVRWSEDVRVLEVRSGSEVYSSNDKRVTIAERTGH
ncbi:N-acetylglucosamine-6-phosphate deacetylase [Microvirga brassicacearum]|uniref:Amidohydrolase family protein n=1 Tax=Microvirga brassicacearum TaxID=2580413 RepID=A0A5N3P9X6_9HYPH|nr:amidohydrolase family protein [Microvirga brassicacearum]KAB0266517.1 amidohydrolase family protein [Microvirga brassicacearum]